MKNERQKQLEKYNITELNTLLEKVKDMIFFPLQNMYQLSKKDLRDMQSDIEARITELSIQNK